MSWTMHVAGWLWAALSVVGVILIWSDLGAATTPNQITTTVVLTPMWIAIAGVCSFAVAACVMYLVVRPRRQRRIRAQVCADRESAVEQWRQQVAELSDVVERGQPLVFGEAGGSVGDTIEEHGAGRVVTGRIGEEAVGRILNRLAARYPGVVVFHDLDCPNGAAANIEVFSPEWLV